MKALLYCTKAKPYLLRTHLKNTPYMVFQYVSGLGSGNGKIVAECEIETERIEFVNKYYPDEDCYDWHQTESMREHELLRRSCLRGKEIDEYLKGKDGYAIHIKNLKIFNKPRELNELEVKTTDFSKRSRTLITDYDETHKRFKQVHLTYFKKAPQNMCLVFDENEWKVLISIRPEWICEILNGKKDVEVRSQVLNCMKERR